MDDKMRARNYYAAAVSLFQDPSVDDCKRAIELLNEAVAFYPDFSEVALFREEVWHCLLRSLDPNDSYGTYKEYLDSPAWQMKRNAVMKRDGYQCICGAKATEVHHKVYYNIGKEPLSDLVALCKVCHEKLPVPSDRPGGPIGKVYWDKFETYVQENGDRLHLFPEPDLPTIYGIQIDRETLNSWDRYKDGAFWLIAYRDSEILQANLCMQSSIHYSHLKKQRDIIKGQFEDNLGELKWQDDKRWVGFFDNTVKHVSRANTDREFPWLHDRLLRLHSVFQPRVLELQR